MAITRTKLRTVLTRFNRTLKQNKTKQKQNKQNKAEKENVQVDHPYGLKCYKKRKLKTYYINNLTVKAHVIKVGSGNVTFFTRLCTSYDEVF